MRWLLLLFVLSYAFQAFAGPALNPAPAGTDKVQVILATVDPAKPDTSTQAEESLVALGKDGLPAMQAVMGEICPALDAAQEAQNWQQIQLLTAQNQVLDRAMVRLQTGINPPQLIRQWVKQQYKPEQQQVAETMPESVRITDPQVQNAFPEYLCYVSRYRQYPVARMIPPPLSANNLFVVRKRMPVYAGWGPPAEQVILITDIEGLKKFFLTNWALGNIAGNPENLLKDATFSWLRLSTELHNDGFFQFVIPLDALKVAASGADAGGYRVTGRADVAPIGANGGNITAELYFDAHYKLIDIKETVNLKSGIRPICQATKLLDPDPIVRKMAEQDLLIMGTAAYDYMMERRAEASPELQAAIDRMWLRILERARE